MVDLYIDNMTFDQFDSKLRKCYAALGPNLISAAENTHSISNTF